MTAYSTISMAHSEADDEIEEKASTQERLFFGEQAYNNFWNLYKSNREFKDYDPSKKKTEDPRFAYIKICDDLKVHPLSSLLIKEEKTSVLDFSNKQML